jgi:hypothetical protein
MRKQDTLTRATVPKTGHETYVIRDDFDRLRHIFDQLAASEEEQYLII